MKVVERGYFEALAEALCGPGPGEERVSLLLAAESSSFIRFNRGNGHRNSSVDRRAGRRRAGGAVSPRLDRPNLCPGRR